MFTVMFFFSLEQDGQKVEGPGPPGLKSERAVITLVPLPMNVAVSVKLDSHKT